jgi:hypothetical protein
MGREEESGWPFSERAGSACEWASAQRRERAAATKGPEVEAMRPKWNTGSAIEAWEQWCELKEVLWTVSRRQLDADCALEFLNLLNDVL